MKIITTTEVAKIFGVQGWTIRKMLREGKLSGKKITARQWIIYEDLKFQKEKAKRKK